MATLQVPLPSHTMMVYRELEGQQKLEGEEQGRLEGEEKPPRGGQAKGGRHLASAVGWRKRKGGLGETGGGNVGEDGIAKFLLPFV